MLEVLKILLPFVCVIASIVGSLWVTTTQIINNKASERIILLRKEFADFFSLATLLVHVRDVDESTKLDYAKKAFHILFLLNSEDSDELRLRESLNTLIVKIPKYLDDKNLQPSTLLPDLGNISGLFDLIMKKENAKLKRKILFKFIPYNSR